MTETIVETIEEELERFRDKLAEGVAIGTEMSAPAYLFSMMGPIVTINKRLVLRVLTTIFILREFLKSSHFRPARNTIGSITSGRSRTGKESGSGSDS